MPKYDAVILGAGVAGCAVAALLSKGGKRVLIMDPAKEPGGSSAPFELQGMRFSGWPTCTYGFEEGGAWNNMLRELGLPRSDAGAGASYQVALPGRRITVSPDPSATLEELRREYPAEIDALSRFYRDSAELERRLARSRISSFVARRRRAGGLLRSYGFSRELQAFFSAASFVFFGRTVQDLALSELVRLVATPPRVISDGFSRIAEELRGIVVRHGGECRLGDPWPELLVRRSRLEGIQSVQGRIDLRSAVLNIPWRIHEATLFAVVQEEVLPVGMLDTVIVAGDYDRPGESLLLSLEPQVSPAPSGGRIRPLKAFFSHLPQPDAEPDELIGRVSNIIPFLADFTQASVHRASKDRALHVPNNGDVPRGRQGTRAIPVRLPVRALTVITDSPFGSARVAGNVRAVAARLA